MSGRSKPPSVHGGIQLCAKPGRASGSPSPVSGVHPQGFTVSTPPAVTPFQRNRRIIGWRRAVPFLCHCRGSRHPHVGAAASLIGGGTFLSGSEEPPSAALSLSHEYGSPPYLFLLKVPAAGKGGRLHSLLYRWPLHVFLMKA